MKSLSQTIETNLENVEDINQQEMSIIDDLAVKLAKTVDNNKMNNITSDVNDWLTKKEIGVDTTKFNLEEQKLYKKIDFDLKLLTAGDIAAEKKNQAIKYKKGSAIKYKSLFNEAKLGTELSRTMEEIINDADKHIIAANQNPNFSTFTNYMDWEIAKLNNKEQNIIADIIKIVYFRMKQDLS